jgi:hypothetical protein
MRSPIVDRNVAGSKEHDPAHGVSIILIAGVGEIATMADGL